MKDPFRALNPVQKTSKSKKNKNSSQEITVYLRNSCDPRHQFRQLTVFHDDIWRYNHVVCFFWYSTYSLITFSLILCLGLSRLFLVRFLSEISFQDLLPNTCIRFSLLLGPISFQDFFPRFLSKIVTLESYLVNR